MAILSFDDYIASKKELILLKKTVSRTSVAQMIESVFDQAGIPGAGTLAGTSTTAGVVPTDAVAGFPPIADFNGGAVGYISRAELFLDRSATLRIVDTLWKGGAYTFNANVTLSAQPAISQRCPDYPGSGSVFGKGTEIWLEQVTVGTGNQTVTVTYTDSDGVTGRTTGAVTASAALIVGRCFNLPLQAGDSGVQKIESVVGSVATVGTFNVLIVRPLLIERIYGPGTTRSLDILGTGLPVIYQDSALQLFVQADSTATGSPEAYIEIANK